MEPDIPPAKKRRGRPSLGKPVPVVLDEEESNIARLMGAGVLSAGVRLALRASAVRGIEKSQALAAKYGNPVPEPSGKAAEGAKRIRNRLSSRGQAMRQTRIPRIQPKSQPVPSPRQPRRKPRRQL